MYDLITIGGGLGGAALARSMAKAGARVLVLERTDTFTDRVRGEVLVPWGCEEADRLGLYGLLRESCGHEIIWWDGSFNGMQVLRRDMRDATEGGFPTLTYYHPHMQELVWNEAAAAGATLLRGARAVAVTGGDAPSVRYVLDGAEHEESARLVVGADGRASAVRKWADFEVHRDAERRCFAGVLVDNHRAPEDTMSSWFLPDEGLMSWIFPQGGGRVRTYVGFAAASDIKRLSGEAGLDRFRELQIRTGIPAAYWETAQTAGPLASFDATDNWVAHPFKNGIALIGDAAATGDPTWGQGMSQTLRDVRLLSEALLAEEDWQVAGHRYAEGHDEFHGHVHRADGWYTDLFLDQGPEAEARRARALPRLIEDLSRIVDTPLAGPRVVADEAARRRMFGEDG
jgi:2-polyprenyl-6-methoxyphenol hydroxylase-like FAD-dependent oxidoreductase